MKLFVSTVLLAVAALAQATIPGPIKEDLLRRLNAKEADLEKAIESNNVLGFAYFAQQLNETVTRIEELKAGINGLPDSAGETVAQYFIEETKTIEARVPAQILNPAPDEIVKMKTLYLGVMRYVDRDIQTHPSPMEIKNMVVRIINGEIFYKSINQSDSAVIDAAEKALRLLYRKPMDLLVGQKLPTVDSIHQVIREAGEKIQILRNQGRLEEAAKWQEELKKFMDYNFMLAIMLPFDTIYKMESWWMGAEDHYKMMIQLQMFVHDFNLHHVCKKEPCN